MSCQTMADDLFTFESMNEDEEGGPSEDEYDALNDETFGGDGAELDWEEEHEQLSHIRESNRLPSDHLDLEASLSRLVLDEEAAPPTGGVPPSWPQPPRPPSASFGALKNLCTVEELERQMRQTQVQQQQSYFQPRFPVILQRPPGLPGPVPLPFNPGLQQMNQINHNQTMNQMMNNNQMAPGNQLVTGNQTGPGNQIAPGKQMVHGNQMGPGNQIAPGNKMGPSNQMGPNNQVGSGNQMMNNQMGLFSQMLQNNVGPNNQIANNQMTHGKQMANNIVLNNQIGPNSQMVSNNQMGPNSQMGPSNQINGNQFGTGQIGPNQLTMMPPHMMGQPRMMPPPGLNSIQRPNFPNQGPFNSNFRSNMEQQKPPMINQQPVNQQPFNPNVNQQPFNQPVSQQQPFSQAISQQQPFNQIVNQQQPFNPTVSQQQPFNPNTNQQQPFNPAVSQQSNFNQTVNQVQKLTFSSQGQPLQNQQQNNQAQAGQAQHTPQGLNQSAASTARPAEKQKQQGRSLVFNNSNLAAQNLVQLIQSTHPMLVHGSRHNASHHPVLNRSAGTNQQYWNMGQGVYINRHLNGEGEPDGRPVDEYAGLMSPREKQWLLNIQMLQLNTGTPYIEDFYYTVWRERRARKERVGVKEAHKANQQNHPLYSSGKQESRERHRHNSTSDEQPTPRTYVPTQFENSLGKLQCGSVTAPRKIIDVEVVREEGGGRASRAPSVASTSHPHEGPREVRRTKQTLLDIEALYLVLLRLEELNDPLAIANAIVLREREEKARMAEEAQSDGGDGNVFLRNIESVQRRAGDADKRQVVSMTPASEQAKQKNLLDENKAELTARLFAGLLVEDRLQAVLAVRKGKILLERFLNRVVAPHARLRTLWARVLRALPAAARRDRDDALLPRLAPAFRRYMASGSGWAPILESCAHLAEALDPARPAHALLTPLTLTCVAILMEKASALINTTEASSYERQWTKFLKNLARTLKNTNVTPVRPVEPMQTSDVQGHVRLLESKTTVEILQRGKTQAEFADLAKNELGEILVKYLC